MWDLWWTKWHWGRFSPSTSVSPANFHSTNDYTRIILGWYNREKILADVPSGLSLAPPQETKKNYPDVCCCKERQSVRKPVLIKGPISRAEWIETQTRDDSEGRGGRKRMIRKLRGERIN
jgi:hypothetical protein